MQKIIQGYRSYLLNNPISFLCRIFGCYSINSNNVVEYFIVMKNISKDPKKMEIYDLKGISVERKGSSSDFIGINKLKTRKISNDSKNIAIQIKKDIEFLKKHKVMDYSLLVCFESGSPYNANMNFGIIDILTSWSFLKVLERFCNIFCCKNNSSCINPDMYMRRFMDMIEACFM